MKAIFEIVLMLIPLILFFTGIIISIENLLIGITFIFTSLFIWGISAELENNKKDSITKKIIRGLTIPVLLISLLILFGIGSYYQEVAYIKYGMLGYLIVGPLGILVIFILFNKILETLKK